MRAGGKDDKNFSIDAESGSEPFEWFFRGTEITASSWTKVAQDLSIRRDAAADGRAIIPEGFARNPALFLGALRLTSIYRRGEGGGG